MLISHCMESVRNRNLSDPYFPPAHSDRIFGQNMGQKFSEYGHFHAMSIFYLIVAAVQNRGTATIQIWLNNILPDVYS